MQNGINTIMDAVPMNDDRIAIRRWMPSDVMDEFLERVH